jgi:hypothetical protein
VIDERNVLHHRASGSGTIGAQGRAGAVRGARVLRRFLTIFFAAATAFFHFYLALLFTRLQAGRISA